MNLQAARLRRTIEDFIAIGAAVGLRLTPCAFPGKRNFRIHNIGRLIGFVRPASVAGFEMHILRNAELLWRVLFFSVSVNWNLAACDMAWAKTPPELAIATAMTLQDSSEIV